MRKLIETLGDSISHGKQVLEHLDSMGLAPSTKIKYYNEIKRAIREDGGDVRDWP